MTTPFIRRATNNDLPAIVALLADDPLGAAREDASTSLNPRYTAAFNAIEQDANQLLAVVVENQRVIGCLQVSFIPGLSRLGLWRGQIESVRIAASHRGQGLGHVMFDWAIAECQRRGCGLIQLTTDKTRPDALRFYEALGFKASHEGLKLTL
ncbi:MAG TPA: GNAT family N-acetyltransferase [Dongiaceae bacterium]|nr:GNAT family N-acetyltransferase [Dongiaceae bacterium]